MSKEILQQISENLQKGKAKQVKELAVSVKLRF